MVNFHLDKQKIKWNTASLAEADQQTKKIHSGKVPKQHGTNSIYVKSLANTYRGFNECGAPLTASPASTC